MLITVAIDIKKQKMMNVLDKDIIFIYILYTAAVLMETWWCTIGGNYSFIYTQKRNRRKFSVNATAINTSYYNHNRHCFIAFICFYFSCLFSLIVWEATNIGISLWELKIFARCSMLSQLPLNIYVFYAFNICLLRKPL